MKKNVFWMLLIIGSIGLQAQTPASMRGHAKYRRRGLMNGNLVFTYFWNYCEVGSYPDDPSGCWPTPEQHYLDDITLVVSVEAVNGDGNLIHPMETQYREFVDTSPEGVPWGFEARPNWFNMDEGSNSSPAMSNNPSTWPDYWLDQPLSWAGYWNGFFGKGIFNADLETVFVFDDNPDKEPNLTMNFYCDDRDSTRGGVGLVVKARGFQWSQVLAEDCIFWLYDITNESTNSYQKSFFSQYIDWGIGGIGGNIQNIGEYNLDLDIAFAYGPPGALGYPGSWEIGYAGYAFLESPGISSDGKDNDNDGMTDETRESDGPGVYLAEYPYGFNDAEREKFIEVYGYSPTAHWSSDEDCDWIAYTDLNDNGSWDQEEPLNDDVGEDGVGPYDLHYEGPDVGEGDGLPTNGEPNFNATDPDESDQIGLTGFDIFPTHRYELTDDEGNWGVFSRLAPPLDEIEQPNNLSMFFSSGSFPLKKDQTERYSMALLFGEDKDDLVKNKKAVQQIYNADYQFAKPPLKPTLKIYPGDGEVTLVWDDVAEKSFDPFLQEFDFEGYMIYRGTEPQFLENKVITDSYGNSTYRKPIAQFDLRDGKKGPHPIDIYGIKFNQGDDTGLRHTYTDYDVKNGQTYYYAVVAYDYGYYTYSNEGVEGLQPSECSSIISMNSLGQVTFTDINCGIAIPRPAAAGYIPPSVEGDIDHIGPGTGSISIDLVEKYKIPSGETTYEVAFLEDSKFHTETFPYLTIRNVAADTLLLDSTLVNIYGLESPVLDGITVTVFNDTSIWIDEENCRFLNGSFDYIPKIRLNPDNENVGGYRLNINQPSDYIMTFYDSVYTYSQGVLGYKSLPSNVGIYNVTDSSEALYAIADIDKDGKYSHGDDIVIIVPDADFIFKRHTSWMIRFTPLFEIDTVWVDNVPYADTTWITVDPPSPGDQCYIATTKPFRNTTYKMVFDTTISNGTTIIDTSWAVYKMGDVFRFTLNGADSSNTLAKNELDDICVVPNPYVVTASWEPRNMYKFGRGERRLHFYHLPKDCTIRIYNLRGYLVDTIEHHSTADDGMEPWDILSKDDNEIAYGIYVFHVDAPGIGEKIGRFALIK
ncbi:MAG: hypothetical protein JXR87_06700 [Candidatus Marinimicrobia bacterium]|nr:hypothetical protein [Candidatus Neomarinimicrobiota bacterium]